MIVVLSGDYWLYVSSLVKAILWENCILALNVSFKQDQFTPNTKQTWDLKTCRTILYIEIKLVKSQSVKNSYCSAYQKVLFPCKNYVSNCPFLCSFPFSFIILFSSTPFCGSRSFVLMFEFSLADRLSQIISFNSLYGTKTHLPCNFLIISFPFEALECRLVRCQL